MAMRLYTETEFCAELKMLGLAPTDKKTIRSQIWLDANEEPITIPYGKDRYPDHVLDEIRMQLAKLKSKSEIIEEKSYDIDDGHKIINLNRS